MNEVGKRLDSLLKVLRTNQLRLANETGLQQTFISSIIIGKKEISRNVLEHLVQRYPNVNLTWLLTGNGEMFLPENGNLVSQEAIKAPRESINTVLDNALVDDAELRKTLAINLVTLARRWKMKKNELFVVLAPGVKKQTVTNYFAGTSQPPLAALVRLEELTRIGLSAWVTSELDEREMPFEPLTREQETLDVKLENVRESLRAMLARIGG